ncbi:MAG: FkbM family methyltransferase [Frankia sp.]
MATIRTRDVRRFGRDLRDVARATDAATTAAYLGEVVRTLPAIARSRSLVPADERMAGRIWPFQVACTQVPVQVPVDGTMFAGAREMYARRVYFPPIAPALTIPRGGNVVDLGANHGLFTCLAAHVAARVVAVEAQSGFVAAVAAAARASGGRAQVTVEHALIGAGSGLVADPDWVTVASDYQTPPPVIGLTDLLDRHALRTVDFMKIDIEGSEFDLFDEGLDWLPRTHRIAMEVHTEFGDPGRLRTLLEESGFETVMADNELRPTNVVTAESGYLYAWRR